MLNRSASLAMSTSVLKALPGKLISKDTHLVFSIYCRVATVREKVLENEKFSRSGKSQGITFSVREI